MRIRVALLGCGLLEAFLVLAVVSAGTWLGWERVRLNQARQILGELERPGRVVAGEGAASLDQARRESDQARRAWESLAVRWTVALGAEIVSHPGAVRKSRTDAFFELAQGIEELRGRLRKAGVDVAEGERFGFESYRHAGPVESMIAAVFRQQRQAVRLVDAVVAGPAVAFVRLEREALGIESGDSQGLGDFFVPDSGLRLALPEGVGQEFFRVAFAGDTAALRGFLVRLAETSPDACVRWIEVQPESELRRPGSLLSGPAENVLRIEVTVAFIEWVPANAIHRSAKS